MTFLPNLARRPRGDLLLAAEALVLLTTFRIALRLVPFRRILRAITRQHPGPETTEQIEQPTASTLETALRVRWAVEAVSRNVPARFVCFPQSLAAHTMLRRRGVPTAIVYGVGHSPTGHLIAHTWLALGDRIVIGREGSEAFEPIERWT